MDTSKYYIVLFNGDKEIASSKDGTLSKNDVANATSFVVHDIDNNIDVTYSTKLNKNGTASSADGTSSLKRSEIVSLFGGTDNYNQMLSTNNMKMPSEIKSLDATKVTIDGKQVKPTFIVYPDGQVYIEGMDQPVSKKKLKEYFPETYKKIWGLESTDKTGSKESVSQTGGGGGGSSYTPSTPSTPSTSTTPSGDGTTTPTQPSGTTPSSSTTPASDGSSPSGSTGGPSQHSTTSATSSPAGGGGSAPAGGGGGSDLLVDYTSLSTVTSTVNAAVSKLNGVMEGFNALGKVVGDGSIWDGAEVAQFTQAATQYGTYFNDIGTALKELNESLNNMAQLFEETEQKIGQ